MSSWLPVLAEIVGGRKPRTAPVALARLASGAFGVAWMTRLRGADNALVRLELDWRPQHTTWRDGFEELRSEEITAAAG
jgi:hypothetical protein